MRDVFDMFDANHDGSVDKSEFGNVIRALGENPSLKDIDELFSKNASGDQMSLAEFLNGVAPRLSGGTFTSAQIIDM